MTEERREQALPCYEYWRDHDGSVARRIMLGQYPTALGGERWIPGHATWWLDHQVLDDEAFAEIAESEAVRAIGVDALHAPGEDLSPPARDAMTPRLADVQDAIARTTAYIDEETVSILRELPWATPGAWEYDREFDAIFEVRAAYATLSALAEERRAILHHRDRRRGSDL